MRRHAKATSAGSTVGRGSGLATIRSSFATRGASISADRSGALFSARIAAALFSLALLAAGLLPGVASATLTRGQVGFSPITGSGIGVSFSHPSGIALNEANGNIFLNDGSGNNAIQIMNEEGGHPVGVNSPFQITGFQFNNEPSGVGIDNSATSPSKGALYTTDVQASGGKVKKYTLSGGEYHLAGELIPSATPNLDEPLGLAVDPKGNVFVSNYSPAEIIEFSPTGTMLTRFSTNGSTGSPSALAFDSAGDLFVQSYSNHSVYKYTANGSGVIEPAVFTQVVSGGATGVGVDAVANKLFIPMESGHVSEYNASSLAKLGEFGNGVLSTSPTRVVVNPATNRVYVADNGFPTRIYVFGTPSIVPTVTRSAPTELTIGKVTLNGSVNPENLAVTDCRFEYGTSTEYGSFKPCEGAIPTDNSDHSVTAKLTGLQGETTYHFRLSATNANGANVTTDGTFFTPASVLAGEATGLTGTHATLHGTVFPAGVAVTACKFEYRLPGVEESFTKSAPCAESIPTDEGEHVVSAEVTHLLPQGRSYVFRVSFTNIEGTFRSQAKSFETPEAVKTTAATEKFGTGATLNGSVDTDGVELTECTFEYGATTEYGLTVPCSPSPGSIPTDSSFHPVSGSVSGLTSSTLYHYRLVVASADGSSRGPDVSFHTLGPLLEKVRVSFPSMTDTTATIKAGVNPQGQGTAYRFEYVTEEQFDESGYAAAKVVPESVKGVGSGNEEVPISQLISGLTPATTYHVRIILSSLGGTITGPDLVFATYPRTTLSTSCPNEEFRTGPSANLPDCRAYEQASPVDKNGTDVGGEIFHTASSVSGDAVLFQANSGIPGGTGTVQFPTFIARRGATNWSTTGTLVPPTFGERGGIDAFTRDLDLTFVQADTVGPTQENSEVIHDLSNGTFSYLYPHLPTFAAFNFVGASTDDSKIFFENPNGVVPVSSGPAPIAGRDNLFMFDRETGAITLVGVLPASEGGQAPPGGSFGGPYDWFRGPGTGYPETEPTCCESRPDYFHGGATSGNSSYSGEYFTQDEHSVSNDGDKAFFTAGGTGQIYLRKGLNGGSPETVRITASQRTIGKGPGGVESNTGQTSIFMHATPDGSHAFFTSSEELTDEANTGPEPPVAGPALGRATLNGTTEVKRDFIAPAPGRWVAVDAGHIYWTNPSAGTIGRANIDGTGANPSFITGADHPQGIAVDGGHIYWANAANGAVGTGSIGRATLDGTTEVNQSFITGASNPQGIAVNGTYIFWANSGNTNIGRAEIGGGSPNQALINLGSEEVPVGVAVGATQVYWSMLEGGSSSYLERANFDGSAEAFQAIGGLVSGIAVNGSNVFWGNESASRIGRSDLTFGSRVSNFIPEVGDPQGLALDGSFVYWGGTNPSPPASPGRDLYDYDTENGELTDISVDNGDVDGAEVQGVVGISEDGSRVYFAANGDLDGGGPGKHGNCRLTGPSSWDGACNLYLWENGEISFVAPMIMRDESFNNYNDWTNWQPGNRGPNFGQENERPTGMVSADGSTIVFKTSQQLTSYNNRNPEECFGPEGRCPEFYRYHVGDPGVVCVTCNPTGAPPTGGPGLTSISIGAAKIGIQPFVPRNLSADGNQFFFETTDKLVPDDTNGDIEDSEGHTECPFSGGFQATGPACQDVYEWEADGSGSCHAEGGQAGCFYLLTTGKESNPAFFSDSSVSGDDIFFYSHAQLVPQDKDNLMDVYDVRVDGGLAAQHPVTPPHCEGEGCRGAVTSPPPPTGAGTAVFSGPENPKIRRHPKKPHHKKPRHSHKKRGHYRHANTTRRTSR